MDAGLAAVLGATVGAVGTGGAAAIGAVPGRSQTRMQVRVDLQNHLENPTVAHTWLTLSASVSRMSYTKLRSKIRIGT